MGNVTWQEVALALIAAIPSIIAAWYGSRNKAALKTGNNKTVGEMVTEVHGEAATPSQPFVQHDSGT